MRTGIIVALIGLLIVSVGSAIPARAELLWSDVCDVRERMQTFIRKHIPKSCKWSLGDPDLENPCKRIKVDGLFGYEDLRAQPDQASTIAFEAVVHLDKQCFQQLDMRIRSLIAKGTQVISTRKASSYFSKYDADGGPTIIFYFPASDRDLKEVQHPSR